MILTFANFVIIVQYYVGKYNQPDWSDKFCNFYHILFDQTSKTTAILVNDSPKRSDNYHVFR